MSYNLVYKKKAKKFIRTHKQEGLRFAKVFDEVAKDLEELEKHDVIKLVVPKYNDAFRMRIGKYRALFRIVESEIVIIVVEIDSRGDIYKNLENKL